MRRFKSTQEKYYGFNTKTNAPQIVKDKTVSVDWAHGTEVSIELVAAYQKGRASVDDYIELTAIANPHASFEYVDPAGKLSAYPCGTQVLPTPTTAIKPHPYGIELGVLIKMLKETRDKTLAQFLHVEFSRVGTAGASSICKRAGLSPRGRPTRIGTHEAETLYKAMQDASIRPPSTNCLSPIGPEQILAGLLKGIRAEFFTAGTRSPAVYRGNPFQIEVALAYGGGPVTRKVTLDSLEQLVSETDTRTLRQFLVMTFDGLGPDTANRILKEAGFGRRISPGKLRPNDLAELHSAMQSVKLSDGQTMQVLRYANRVPLQFQHGACAITQSVMNTNWRSYGLSQSRGALPSGPVTVMVHMASVWVPFTSESKEAIAAYPEIQKELRLALQAVGRKLGMYLRRRIRVRQEGERRNVFLRYLGEVAGAVSQINQADRTALYDQLLLVARKKTAEADVKLDKHGRPLDEALGDPGLTALLARNGFRVGVGRQADWPAIRAVFERNGARVTRVARTVQEGAPLTIPLGQVEDGTSYFLHKRGGGLGGGTLTAGRRVFLIGYALDADDPQRLVLRATPVFEAKRTREKLVERDGEIVAVRDHEGRVFHDLTVETGLAAGEFLVIGGSGLAEKGFVLGSRWLGSALDMQQYETVLCISAQATRIE